MTALAAVAYIASVITVLINFSVGFEMESVMAMLLSVLYGALSIMGIYVAQALVQAFIDIADVALLRTQKG